MGDIKLGLTNVSQAFKLLGEPCSRITSVLIGGTNGKGSTCRRLVELASTEGYRVGLYSSPHIRYFRERFYLSDTEVSNKDITTHLARLRTKVGEKLYSALSFFEIATLIAASIFEEHEVDLAVFEVGLGGRLDATNILKRDLVLLTSIGLEHQDYLGPTLHHIASEKAGLIRTSAPTILSSQLSDESHREGFFEVFQLAAKTVQSELECASLLTTRPISQLLPEYQRSNFALADAAFEKLHQLSLLPATTSTLANRRPILPIPTAMARFEFREHAVLGWLLLDVCHNPHGARALASSIRSFTKPHLSIQIALVSILADKDFNTLLKELEGVVGDIRPVGFNHPRGWNSSHLESLALASRIVYEDFKIAFESLKNSGKKFSKSSPLLICGSVHIFSIVYAELERLEL